MSADELNFFGFRMYDRNENEIDLSEFVNKDVIIVVNCFNVNESQERAAYYTALLDKNDKKVQVLCLLCSKFFYDSHQDQESLRLITYLKEKSNCHENVEDGLTFLLDNRSHKPGCEHIHYIGNSLTYEKIKEAISKYIQ